MLVLLDELLFSDFEDDVLGMDFIDQESEEDISCTVKQTQAVHSSHSDYTSSEWARMQKESWSRKSWQGLEILSAEVQIALSCVHSVTGGHTGGDVVSRT
jgi:hypothetical protein